jgi:hypothetical protein
MRQSAEHRQKTFELKFEPFPAKRSVVILCLLS